MISQLTDAIKDAEAAHAAHEKAIGRPDPAWASFYANWIVNNRPELFNMEWVQ